MEAAADPQTQRARLRIGQTLRGKWRLDGLLGVGGMAAVYRATHRNGMRGAVKMLHVELTARGEATERFLREGYAANKVEHPGVVRVLDDDVTEDGAVFLVMELLDGQTIDAMAASRPRKCLEAHDVLAAADMLLDVLAAAHEKGIVHRDLKPENLFLTTRGELKVLDFGIARVRELQGSSRATSTGAAMGTPAFMPPEQAAGEWARVDARTDIWAVGATMFTLLTGRPVHEAATVQLLLAAAITKPAPRLATIAPQVPAAVCAIVDRALAFEQDKRFPGAAAMRRDVQAARRKLAAASSIAVPSMIAVTEGSAAGRARGRRPVVVGGVAVAAVASALTVWLVLRGPGASASVGSAGPDPRSAAASVASSPPTPASASPSPSDTVNRRPVSDAEVTVAPSPAEPSSAPTQAAPREQRAPSPRGPAAPPTPSGRPQRPHEQLY